VDLPFGSWSIAYLEWIESSSIGVRIRNLKLSGILLVSIR